MTEMSQDQNERLVHAFEDMAETNHQIAEEFALRRKIDDALVEKWSVDNELRSNELELREREFARMDRWRAEDLERMAKQRDEELDRLFGGLTKAAQERRAPQSGEVDEG